MALKMLEISDLLQPLPKPRTSFHSCDYLYSPQPSHLTKHFQVHPNFSPMEADSIK